MSDCELTYVNAHYWIFQERRSKSLFCEKSVTYWLFFVRQRQYKKHHLKKEWTDISRSARRALSSSSLYVLHTKAVVHLLCLVFSALISPASYHRPRLSVFIIKIVVLLSSRELWAFRMCVVVVLLILLQEKAVRKVQSILEWEKERIFFWAISL